MDLNKVFENNKAWVAKKLSVDSSYFENLAKGQQPEMLYIGCSDSRVSTEELMGADPGDVFVHPVLGRHQPGEQRSPRGRANRVVGVRAAKANPVAGHRVDVRRSNVRVAVTGERPRAVVVGQDQHDVGPLLVGGPNVSRTGRKDHESDGGRCHENSRQETKAPAARMGGLNAAAGGWSRNI